MSVNTIVAVFPSANAAYDAAAAIKALADDKNIHFKLKAGAMFSKDEKGNVILLEEKDRPLWGTLAGGVAGALIGALVGGPVGAAAGAATGGAALGALGGMTTDAVSADIDASFATLVAKEVLPGQTAVVVEADEGSTEPVDLIVAVNGGRVYRS